METRSTFSSTKTPDRKRRRHPSSPIIKRSINLAGHDTSVTLEGEFWNALQDIARSKRVSIPVLIDQIDKDRSGSNLSSSVRLFVLEYFKALSPKEQARDPRSPQEENGPQRLEGRYGPMPQGMQHV
jgi:predicted DNA-binding ribbon-helix-helix protein